MKYNFFFLLYSTSNFFMDPDYTYRTRDFGRSGSGLGKKSIPELGKNGFETLTLTVGMVTSVVDHSGTSIFLSWDVHFCLGNGTFLSRYISSWHIFQLV